jgi:predicted Fe-Mo cluster-binding NifX family protein
MDFIASFATDNGKNLSSEHFGAAQYYYIYKINEGKAQYLEKRENSGYEENETIKGGDPAKAKATAITMAGIDVLINKKFGPNILRLSKKYVCVVVRVDTIDEAIHLILDNHDKVIEQLNAGESRQHLVLS